MTNKELREILSEIEHEQWIAWSKNIAETERITPARLERWKKLWRPYAELTEVEKNQDREWSDKVINSLKTELVGKVEGLKGDGLYAADFDFGFNQALDESIKIIKEI